MYVLVTIQIKYFRLYEQREVNFSKQLLLLVFFLKTVFVKEMFQSVSFSYLQSILFLEIDALLVTHHY